MCTTHQGPGFTNALTGLVEAAKARTPALLLTADTPSAVQWSNFKIDQAAIARECGAIAERVHAPQTASADAARALHRARTERLPVVLNVPIDLPAREADDDRPSPARAAIGRPAPATSDVETVAALLEAASFPLLVAGRGAVTLAGCPRRSGSARRALRRAARHERDGARPLRRSPLRARDRRRVRLATLRRSSRGRPTS